MVFLRILTIALFISGVFFFWKGLSFTLNKKESRYTMAIGIGLIVAGLLVGDRSFEIIQSSERLWTSFQHMF